MPLSLCPPSSKPAQFNRPDSWLTVTSQKLCASLRENGTNLPTQLISLAINHSYPFVAFYRDKMSNNANKGASFSSFPPPTERKVSKLLMSRHPTVGQLELIPTNFLQASSYHCTSIHVTNASLASSMSTTALKQNWVKSLLEEPTLSTGHVLSNII